MKLPIFAALALATAPALSPPPAVWAARSSA